MNILQPLSSDPSFKGMTPQLSSLRLSHTIPSGRPVRPAALPLKIVPRRPFRAIPALSSRIRYHRPPIFGSQAALIATLELDVPVFAQHVIEITNVKVSLSDGIVEDLTHGVLKLPLRCHARDNIFSLYTLRPDSTFMNTVVPSGTSRMLDVVIDARVLVSSICRPKIEIRWKANVDFSTPLNPNFRKPNQSLQRNNRPTSLPTALTPSGQPSGITAAARDIPGALSVSDLGVVISFSSRGDIYVGEPSQWDVFIINQSAKPITLGLAMISKLASDSSKGVPSRPESASANVTNGTGVFADAVVDDNILYASIKSHCSEATQLVCLNADLRVG